MIDMVSSISALIFSIHVLCTWRMGNKHAQMLSLKNRKTMLCPVLIKSQTHSSCFHWITTTAWIKPMSKGPCWSCATDCDIMYYTQTCVLTYRERERERESQSNIEQKHMEMMHSSWSCVRAYSYTFQASLLTIWHTEHTVNMTMTQ